MLSLVNGAAISEWAFSPIPWGEIEAWSRMRRIVMRPWEINALLRLDRIWLAVMAEKGYSFDDDPGNPAPSPPKPAPRRIGR